jgi:pyruvyltransferase
VRMNWMRGGKVGNMGDLLSPIIVAAHTGQALQYVRPVSPRDRLIAIGTIGQKQRFGHVDVWGAGFGGQEGSFQVQRTFRHPGLTRFTPHAVRGPFSAALLRGAGYATPAVMGDPAWLLPRIWPGEGVQKRWDLGVVLHISELAEREPSAGPKPDFLRYRIPEGLTDSIRLLNTVVERDIGQVRARVEDILSCRRILSTSLHALAVAEAYGIPCATFDIHAGASGFFAVDDTNVPIDHRIRDYYAGSGRKDVLVYRTERHLETDWDAAMAFIDQHWQPIDYDPSRLLEVFPRRLAEVEEFPRPEVMARLSSLSHIAPG